MRDNLGESWARESNAPLPVGLLAASPRLTATETTMIRALIERELAWCRSLSKVAHWPRIGPFMAVISRLGDGGFWLVLVAAISIFGGPEGPRVGALMVLAGLVTLAIYKLAKETIARPRPCDVLDFDLREPPLDRWSFPSGHTMHAVAFSVVALAFYPGLFWLLVPFTALVMASRVLLGLHYPSDVLAGMTCGVLIGWAFLSVVAH